MGEMNAPLYCLVWLLTAVETGGLEWRTEMCQGPRRLPAGHEARSLHREQQTMQKAAFTPQTILSVCVIFCCLSCN